MAWLAGWDKRIEIKIEDYANDIGAEVEWWPATIFLTSTQCEEVFVELTTDAEYKKVAITKADGTTELYGENELFDVSEELGIYHVSRDGWVVNANTSVFFYYDKDHADNDTYIGAITARTEVWDGNFAGVYHLVDDNGNVDDSTSNNNDGTKTAAGSPAEATGKIGQGQDFDATDDKIDIGVGANPTTNDFTLEMWMKSIADQDVYIISNRATASPWEGFLLMSQSGDNKLYFQLNDLSNFHGFDSGTTVVNDNTWHYIALVVDHTNDLAHLYVDGAVDAANIDISAVAGGDITSTRTIWIGCDHQAGVYTAKLMDEVRISSVDRSAAWSKGTCNTLEDSLLTYGSEEVKINALFFGSNF